MQRVCSVTRAPVDAPTPTPARRGVKRHQILIDGLYTDRQTDGRTDGRAAVTRRASGASMYKLQIAQHLVERDVHRPLKDSHDGKVRRFFYIDRLAALFDAAVKKVTK